MALSDFPEQCQVVELLQRSLQRGRLGHAYLFVGTACSELENVARALSKVLNCLSPVRVGDTGLPIESCDACSACRRIQEDIHPDVQWVRAESKSGVIVIDQIREVMQTIQLKPTEGRFKVAVVVGADRLNVQSANAFLKTLEEPPVQSVLILLTTEFQKVIETIVSRCLRLTFAGGEGLRFSEEELAFVSMFSEAASEPQKSLLARYRLLGMILNHLAAMKRRIEEVLSARSPLERYDDVDPKLRGKWEDELEAAIEAEYRRRRTEVVSLLQWWLRDIWLQTLGMAHEQLAFPKLAPMARRIAERLAPEDAVANLKAIERTQRLLGTNVQEALALEVGLIKLKL